MSAPTPLSGDSAAPVQSLYEARKNIHVRSVSGRFSTWRWALVWITQAVFYGLCWLPWNGRQAVLFELAERKFYIFGLIFWPQDVFYLAVLLIIAAYSLFLFTAIGGRLFCGYACPQTVYTEIFMWIEEKIEGGRNSRMKLDAEPMSARKFGLKAAKHGIWIALGLWTGFTFVGYFTPIRTLANEVLSFNFGLGPWETFWILFYGFTTYGNAGWMREQVCKYMCPYARFQSAMFDHDTLIVTYDAERGEPRGARSKKQDYQAAGKGSCVDCGICVQVCPTGIDIRDGLQYECIGCSACIDGCDQEMDKMSYPRGLIRYSTEHAMQAKWGNKEVFAHVLRPRTLIYGVILALIIIAAGAALALRMPLKVDVIRDRVEQAREDENLMIENHYRLQIMNVSEVPQRYLIDVSGMAGIFIESERSVVIPPLTTQSVSVEVHVPPASGKKGYNRIYFAVKSLNDERIAVREKSNFLIP